MSEKRVSKKKVHPIKDRYAGVPRAKSRPKPKLDLARAARDERAERERVWMRGVVAEALLRRGDFPDIGAVGDDGVVDKKQTAAQLRLFTSRVRMIAGALLAEDDARPRGWREVAAAATSTLPAFLTMMHAADRMAKVGAGSSAKKK